MKRKRGHKKGKHKQSHASNVVNVNPEYSSVLEDQEFDNTELDSEMEDQPPAPTKSDELAKLSNSQADGFADRPSGQGRVKVKLKSSKLLETQHAHSDAQTQSDTDKSSSHLSLEKQEEVERMNDGVNFLSEMRPTVSANSSRRTGSIKIKSSRGVSSLSTPINQTSGSLQSDCDRSAQFASDILKTIGGTHQNEHKVSHQDSRYNKKELNTSLEVIRKIMKMDAAEPFNAPVNPIALGIPDYFDIIETPMDFGTICSNLEQGRIYKNSEDVYKDVQYIWENCYRYNNKGDYIVDLMKRVKKNFMKYWTAAGLYSNQSKKINGSERVTVETTTPSSQEIEHVKGTHSKQHKKRGRHGFNKHKSDCLCAVCVVRRRRKEREREETQTQIELSDGNMSQDLKETSIGNHHHGSEEEDEVEEGSSNLVANSPDPYQNNNAGDMEDESNKFKIETPPQKQTSEPDDDDNDHSDPDRQSEEIDDSSDRKKQDTPPPPPPTMKEEAIEEMDKLQDSSVQRRMQQQPVISENLLLDRNPQIINLCGALFPSKSSVWSGPHSLVVHRQHKTTNTTSAAAIHAALEMFIK